MYVSISFPFLSLSLPPLSLSPCLFLSPSAWSDAGVDDWGAEDDHGWVENGSESYQQWEASSEGGNNWNTVSSKGGKVKRKCVCVCVCVRACVCVRHLNYSYCL